MKRKLFLCFLLQYLFTSVFAQNAELKHKWTIAAVYSPRLEKYGIVRNFHEHYPLSPGISIGYRVNEDFSLSLGTSLNYEKIIMKPLVFKEPPTIVNGYSTTTLYGFPVQLKYFYTKDKSGKILPFFKTAFIPTYARLYSEILFVSQDLTIQKQNEFYIYWQLGYGASAKIYKGLSMTAQVAIGVDVREKSPEKYHIEPGIGLQYNLK